MTGSRDAPPGIAESRTLHFSTGDVEPPEELRVDDRSETFFDRYRGKEDDGAVPAAYSSVEEGYVGAGQVSGKNNKIILNKR